MPCGPRLKGITVVIMEVVIVGNVLTSPLRGICQENCCILMKFRLHGHHFHDVYGLTSSSSVSVQTFDRSLIHTPITGHRGVCGSGAEVPELKGLGDSVEEVCSYGALEPPHSCRI